MRNKKYALVDFAFFDRTGIQNFLEKQAKKGWLLQKAKGSLWLFERIAPQGLHYSVVYFPGASLQYGELNERQKTFLEFCEHSGWKLVDARGTMHIFVNEAEDPVPIETDPLVELETIHKAVKKEYIGIYRYNLLLATWQILGAFSNLFWNPVEFFSARVYMMLVYLVILGWSVFELLHYYSWRKKAKEMAAANGSFVKTRSYPFVSWVMIAVMLVLLLTGYVPTLVNPWFILICFSIMTCSLVLIAKLVRGAMDVDLDSWKSKFSSAAKLFAIFGLFILMFLSALAPFLLKSISGGEISYSVDGIRYSQYTHAIPLTVEDVMDVEYDRYSYEVVDEVESIWLGQYEARQEPRVGDGEHPQLRYRVVTVKAAYLYEMCANSMLEELSGYTAGDARPWGAEAAYETLEEDSPMPVHWLLCYEDKLVELRLSWKPTPEQMAIMAEKLGGL